ncbi:MAG: alanine or glycine:cation symporter, family [Clostridiales bacterium]|nr:alanine or glycine:cation symporter, family [Clostridiales bacterium]
MLETINRWIDLGNSFLWDFALLFLLCGTGVFFTVKLGFVQVRFFKEGLRRVFGNIRLRGDKAGASGMSSFQSLATAVAAQVGTGNIAGAATAIASGGPGAIFWMWLSAFFGMATIFAEATLAQTYKKTVDGEVTGGPVYYIRARFAGRFGKLLAGFFSIAVIVALGFMGNMVQSNSISDAFATAFGTPPLVVGIVVALMAAVIFWGGKGRIAAATEKIVPVMALFYVLGSVVVLAMNARQIPAAFEQIFVMAFRPQSMLGGAIGVTVQKAVRYGVARGLFSNEAGMGSTPHAHALAKVQHPCEQGVVAMIGVFIDTFIILTMTTLVILTTGALGSGETGAALAQNAFHLAFGRFGSVFIAICMLFFAFSTILGWYFFGEVNVKYLFGKRAVKIYSVLVLLFIVVGSLMKVQMVWNLSDLFNGLMVIPNLIAVLALTGVVSQKYREYRAKQKQDMQK